jgi:cation transport regulator
VYHAGGCFLPYATTEDLPSSVRDHLPLHAQEIYRAAFNSTWENYRDWGWSEREDIAYRIAWSAVKRRYRKAGDIWVER